MLGRHMMRVQFSTVFLVSLTLGLSLAVPMEDLSDTVSDESEALPYYGSLPDCRPHIQNLPSWAAFGQREREEPSQNRQIANQIALDHRGY